MAKAVWEGAILADSTDTVLIEGNPYFPPQSLNRNFFRGRAQPDTTPLSWTAGPITMLPGTTRIPNHRHR